MRRMLILALVCLPVVALGQSRKEKRAEADTHSWRYELEAVGVGSGNIVVKSWSYSKKSQIAAEQSKKNAIHGIIFKGVPANEAMKEGRKPLVEDVNAMDQYSAFFDAFFAPSGAYQRFVTLTSNGTLGGGSVIKMSNKEYKVGVVVTVQYDQLRKYLEENGIIKKLGISSGKKPILMVVPSTAWCINNGYVTQFDDMGTIRQVPDFERAINNDQNLMLAISALSQVMVEYEFPLKDLEATLRSLNNEKAEESVTTSNDGDVVAVSPLDELRRVANHDIELQLDYRIDKVGPKSAVTFNIRALDAYTQKAIASAMGDVKESFSVSIASMLKESVATYMPSFTSQLQGYFEDMAENGREVKITLRRWTGSDVDFESEFDGEELSYLLEDWLADNAVKGTFSTTMASKDRMIFEQVRIPLTNAAGRDIDARRWVSDMQRFLRNNYGIESKLQMQGLGHVYLTIGYK